MEIKKDKLLDMLKTMLKIRYFELEIEKLSREGKIPGGYHLYIGEEALFILS